MAPSGGEDPLISTKMSRNTADCGGHPSINAKTLPMQQNDPTQQIHQFYSVSGEYPCVILTQPDISNCLQMQ